MNTFNSQANEKDEEDIVNVVEDEDDQPKPKGKHNFRVEDQKINSTISIDEEIKEEINP